MPTPISCDWCTRRFPTKSAKSQHVQRSPECLRKREEAFQRLTTSSFSAGRGRRAVLAGLYSSSIVPEDGMATEDDVEKDSDNVAPIEELDPEYSPPSLLPVDYDNLTQSTLSSPTLGFNDGDSNAEPPSRRARVEEEPDDRDRRFAEPFPSNKYAGATFGTTSTSFDTIRDEQILHGAEILGPFENDEEWALAKWLIKNVGHNAAEEFLKLAVIQHASAVSFTNKDELYKRIDQLPNGVSWHCKEVVQEGDLKDANGRPLTERLELWYRDPVECVQELMGNPVFKNHLAYAPTRVYQDQEGHVRQIDEMWTGNWWWNVQQRLPAGATVVPIILSSDKTKLSQFRGDKSAWPIYLTVGNLAKNVRRSPSMHGTILLGYLPVGKFDCFSEATQPLARYQAFHTCVRIILDSLIAAGRDGTKMACADGQLRHVYPVLAAYAADYPEQCLVACCQENRCPTGQVLPEKRGEHEPCVPRDKNEILRLLDLHHRGELSPGLKERFKDLGLRAVHEPFWRDLPHADIFSCFTPDLLHQLHKGVFKDHLVKWCTVLLGEDEMDKRFRDVPPTTGLRHFKNGISHVSQWTGHEHKEMEKIFVALVAGGVPDEVLIAVRALIDFVFTASLQSHTTLTLLALRAALDNFHAHKQAFIEYRARNPAHFNIPKYHMLEHYVDLIYNLGSADGFNTEWSERLHIDYAKEAYRASNKKDYTAQMTRWLSRQEAVDRFAVYIDWCRNGSYSPSPAFPPDPLEQESGTIVLQNGSSTAHSTSPFSGQTATTGTSPLEPTKQPELESAPFKVPRTHTKELRAVSCNDIVVGHGASQFLPALQEFLRRQGARITARSHDHFSLYKQIVVKLPTIPEVSASKTKDVIKATPPVPAKGRRAAQCAKLDFALIRTGEYNEYTDGTALAGLRVGLVRVLFKLPPLYQVHHGSPLAYVEWFTPFRAADPISGMHVVSRSTRMHAPYAEIIEATRLVRSCHLMPRCGRVKEVAWTSDEVRDRCRTFFHNVYIDYHMYCTFKLGIRGCL